MFFFTVFVEDGHATEDGGQGCRTEEEEEERGGEQRRDAARHGATSAYSDQRDDDDDDNSSERRARDAAGVASASLSDGRRLIKARR